MDAESLGVFLFGMKGDVSWWQMSLRGITVFIYGLLLVRFPGQRIFGKSSAFDIVLAVLVGSNLSRALTGNSPFIATLAATTVIVMIHWGVAHLAAHSRVLSWLAKGAVVHLVTDGQPDRRRMARHGITDGDLEEAMRQFGVERLDQVKTACLERNGKISVVPK
ncbi:MAG TPA: YetF domain-containing protein [Magnetospirillum sp.]|jgi:uncharacterized membrane protein YcaP (DUF421 family)|nr:YetF domain-containing protein [Magnetospirillum sp.]